MNDVGRAGRSLVLAQIRRHEALLTPAVGTLLVLVMTLPAYGAYFFAEDFVYVGQYYAHGQNFWQAAFSPIDGIFFRPVFFAANLPWQYLLPPDPRWHHLRNLALTAVNIGLLDRVLRRLTTRPTARLGGLALFVVSKIQLTTIGYINVYESVLTLALLLATVLFWLRFFERRALGDYLFALGFCFLSIFTKDYGLVVTLVVAGLAATHAGASAGRRSKFTSWVRPLAPLPLMVGLYLVVRYATVGPLPTQNAVYGAQLSPGVSATKLLMLTATLGNLSFGSDGVTGSSLGASLAKLDPTLGTWPDRLDVVNYGLLLALIGVTLWSARRAGWVAALPLIWIGAYFGPTLLTRNEQIYYLYEPLAGCAVLLALCLDRAGRRLARTWGLALVAIAALGTLSNYSSLYTWQFVANAAQRIQQPVLDANRGQPLESITFVTAFTPLWSFALTSDELGPMIPFLLRRPDLRVDVISDQDAADRQLTMDAQHVVYDVDAGFSMYDSHRVPTPLALRGLSPDQVRLGQPFNLQPGGESAIGLAAEGVTPDTVVVVAGRRLTTTIGSTSYLTALVPDDVLTAPGTYQVYLANANSESNRMTLRVTS